MPIHRPERTNRSATKMPLAKPERDDRMKRGRNANTHRLVRNYRTKRLTSHKYVTSQAVPSRTERIPCPASQYVYVPKMSTVADFKKLVRGIRKKSELEVHGTWAVREMENQVMWGGTRMLMFDDDTATYLIEQNRRRTIHYCQSGQSGRLSQEKLINQAGMDV